jgi:hypothetical protein
MLSETDQDTIIFHNALAKYKGCLPIELQLTGAAGSRRRSKAVADVNNSLQERLSHLQTRLDDVLKDACETRYLPNCFVNLVAHNG